MLNYTSLAKATGVLCDKDAVLVKIQEKFYETICVAKNESECRALNKKKEIETKVPKNDNMFKL